jgi:predicted nuclease with TOPRIM domain
MSESTEITRRLDKMDEKLEKMMEFVIQLARYEEKHAALVEKTDELDDRYDKMDKRVSTLELEKFQQLEDAVKENTRITTNISRLLWVIGTSTVAVVTREVAHVIFP